MMSGVYVTNGLAKHDILDLVPRQTKWGSYVAYYDGNSHGDLGDSAWRVIGLPDFKEGPYSIFQLCSELNKMKDAARRRIEEIKSRANIDAIVIQA